MDSLGTFIMRNNFSFSFRRIGEVEAVAVKLLATEIDRVSGFYQLANASAGPAGKQGNPWFERGGARSGWDDAECGSDRPL
jgi:hypothetical protein